jgi:hypothetical protein
MKLTGENLSQCYFAHHKSHMDRPGIELLPMLLTPWSRILLKDFISIQEVKTIPALFGNRRFITVFTRARHWTLY